MVLIGLGIVLGYMGWIYWPEIIGAGWSPTPIKNVKKMLEMAKVGKDDVVYDLGCGDGRIIAMAAGEFDARAVGIEADPLRFLFSFVRVKVFSRGKAKVVWGNFFHKNLRKATVVTVFLSNEVNSKLKEKLKRELSSGTRVISYYWVFDGWEIVKSNSSSRLYMYKIEN